MIYEEIYNKSCEIEDKLINIRRDIHKHPETGWLEMRTSAFIKNYLEELGFEFLSGREVCSEEFRMGVPDTDILKAHYTMLMENKEENFCDFISDDMKDGFTGVIGVLRCGDGPCVSLRFDIDALPMEELHIKGHVPFDKGFDSIFTNMMHACGHDAHAAIGLGTAEVLVSIKDKLHGTLKLIFQPAEEGTRGALSIVKNGHLDNTDYFLSGHVSYKNYEDDFDLIPGSYGALATCKYKVTFKGLSAHAGRAPEEGKSAVLAACHAVTALQGIERHSGGVSRVNIGSIHGGSGCNIVPDEAYITLEVRGGTDDINDFMCRRVEEICNGAAVMEGCTCRIEHLGKAPSEKSDTALSEVMADLVENTRYFKVSSNHQFKNSDSEDVGFMMNYVQNNGGQAVYSRLMTRMASPQHTVGFDIDEDVIKCGVYTFSSTVAGLLK